jgi:ABC-type branched-subunit amino acid transport system ATPase component
MSFLVAENISLQFGGLKAVDKVNFADIDLQSDFSPL